MCFPVKFVRFFDLFLFSTNFAENLQRTASNEMIIARLCSLKWKMKGKLFLKNVYMSNVYINIFNEFKDNDHIATILTCSYKHQCFSKKC